MSFLWYSYQKIRIDMKQTFIIGNIVVTDNQKTNWNLKSMNSKE